MFLDLFGFHCFMFSALKIDLNSYLLAKTKIVSTGLKGWLNNNPPSVNRYLVFSLTSNTLAHVTMDAGEVFFVMFCDRCATIHQRRSKSKANVCLSKETTSGAKLKNDIQMTNR